MNVRDNRLPWRQRFFYLDLFYFFSFSYLSSGAARHDGQGLFLGQQKRRLIGETLGRQMGWVAGSKGWLAEEDSKRKTGKRRKGNRRRGRWRRGERLQARRGERSSEKEKLARGRRSAGMVSIQLDLFAFIPFCYDFWFC